MLTHGQRAVKRAFDLIVGSLLLVGSAPLLALSALAIKLDSPGPIFYRQKRIGEQGREFHMFKLRTMIAGADRAESQLILAQGQTLKFDKKATDRRVTRVGRFLRIWSIDELPQLLNVLKRDMSMVGPRMISPEEMSLYRQFDMNLLTVLPGITGLWQVSGRSDISYDERVRLDMYYIRNWSIWLDLQLLLQTLPAVLGSRGAY